MHHLHCIFIVCPTKACDYKLLDLIKPILVENCHSVLHLQMQVAWKRTKQRKAKEKQTPESAGTSMPPETWSWKSTQGQKPKQSKRNTENTWKTQRIWKKYAKPPHSTLVPFCHALWSALGVGSSRKPTQKPTLLLATWHLVKRTASTMCQNHSQTIPSKYLTPAPNVAQEALQKNPREQNYR